MEKLSRESAISRLFESVEATLDGRVEPYTNAELQDALDILRPTEGLRYRVEVEFSTVDGSIPDPVVRDFHTKAAATRFYNRVGNGHSEWKDAWECVSLESSSEPVILEAAENSALSAGRLFEAVGGRFE